MPVVTVDMLEAHSMDEKRQLIRDITDAFVKTGVSADDVNIIIRETPKSCWAISGQLCSDFKVPEGA